MSIYVYLLADQGRTHTLSPFSSLPSHTHIASGVILVTGATGGVGKRVVEQLLKKGLRVRGLARNKQKALAFHSQGKEPSPDSLLEIVEADVSKPQTLTPAIFKDVVAVVACTAAIVQPKVGDNEDRAKYYQGIVFYEPETVDRPVDVDYEGMVNTVNAALKYSNLKEKKLFGCTPDMIEKWKQWAGLDDVVSVRVRCGSLSLAEWEGKGKRDDRPSHVLTPHTGDGRTF